MIIVKSANWHSNCTLGFSPCSTIPTIPTIRIVSYLNCQNLHSAYVILNPLASSLGSYKKMNQISIWVLLILIFFLTDVTKSAEQGDKEALITFLGKLSGGNGQPASNVNWSMSTDPCLDWEGIKCDRHNIYVRKIFLDGLNLAGTFNVGSLCNVQSLSESLSVLSLNDNKISGNIPPDISNCKQLTRLHVGRNQFSGSIPRSLSSLKNLKILEFSNNSFSGKLPDFSHISGLIIFLAENNQLIGKIPKFDFSNFVKFNVSFNNFTGSIPDVKGSLSASSFEGNPNLCGYPLPNKCPPNGLSNNDILIYSGYALIGLALVIFIPYKITKRNKGNKEKTGDLKKVAAIDESILKTGDLTSEYKMDVSKSQVSMVSADQSALISSSLVVLTSPVVNGLKFEDLLKAPAELLGKGKYGSVYKVIFENGMNLAVKRIKDWAITSDDFKLRMQKIDQVKHPNLMPALAFYCSKQEKLLVYEYLPNGSLFRLLQGTQMGQPFDWGSRLGVAATIAETLAFMHQELLTENIAHGNLKSTNILFNKNMEPCISEYGLMVEDPHNQENLSANLMNHHLHHTLTAQNDVFKADIYAFGVILLELLTGKLVQRNGFDLAKWVLSVVREEWTAEVFDKSLISEDANEERMVNLLQVAVKCVNRSPDARPAIGLVVSMINSIKEEEERSVASEV